MNTFKHEFCVSQQLLPYYCPGEKQQRRGGVVESIVVAGSFSGGGQPLCPAKIQSFPAKKFSCQGGPSSPILFCQAAVPSYSAKLFCKLAKMADKWLKNGQKWRKNWNMWQKATKNGRKQIKMIGKLAKCCVFQIIHC